MFTKKKIKRLRGVYFRAERKKNEQFGRKMNQDMSTKLFWKGVNKVMGERWRIAVEQGMERES